MKTQSFSVEIAGKVITADITDLAGQTNGSVLMRSGETTILVTAVMGENEQPSLPHLPLSVEFKGCFYADGVILGNSFKRNEVQPSKGSMLSARIIDRTIRPLFDYMFRREIKIVVTVLAVGEDDPDILAVIGSSLALAISDIPWNGPIGAVRIGRERSSGRVIINPTFTERAEGNLDFEILACGKERAISMIETSAEEIAEDDVLAVLEASTIIHNQLESFQQTVIEAVAKQKVTIKTRVYSEDVIGHFSEQYATSLYETLFSGQAGKGALMALKEEFLKSLPENAPKQLANDYFEEQIDTQLHYGVLKENKRPDGRDFDAIRPLFAQAGGISPVLHGAGIFYCGDTHIFSALTLDETGQVDGCNGRMIDHGTLAEKALTPVIPNKSIFPYTTHLISKTLSGNSSSSMESICASTLALLDGGVPILRPVAGIALGALIDGDIYKVLTDVAGLEDKYGDINFKVAGTTLGITAIEMDVKANGVTLTILTEALLKARDARLEILKVMKAAIPVPRTTIFSKSQRTADLQS